MLYLWDCEDYTAWIPNYDGSSETLNLVGFAINEGSRDLFFLGTYSGYVLMLYVSSSLYIVTEAKVPKNNCILILYKR